jgi:hypothetical protein
MVKPVKKLKVYNGPEKAEKPKVRAKGGLLTVYVSLWERDPTRDRPGRIWAYLPVDDSTGEQVPGAQREKQTFDRIPDAREWARVYGYNGIRIEHAKWDAEATRRQKREVKRG